MWSKFKQFLTKTDKQKNDNAVSGRYISRERTQPTVLETVNKLFQFKAGENFGSIFELSGSPMQSIKSELDEKITKLKKELETESESKKKELIAFAIKNIEELDIYEIKAVNNELKREYICKFKDIGA